MQIQGTPSISVTLAVTVAQFRPLGGVFPITATYAIVSASPGVTVTGADITIQSSQPATVAFQLTDPAYVFVGATFDADVSGTQVGTTEFPLITINRTSLGNTLTVADANVAKDAGTAYNYILLVQNTATGEIGIIDPMIVSDTGP